MKKEARIKKRIAALLCAATLLALFGACNGATSKDSSHSPGNQVAEKTAKPPVQTAQDATIKPQASPAVDVETDAPSNPHDAVEKTRAALDPQLEQIESRFAQNPDNASILLQYAQILFSLGDFDQSQAILQPVLAKENPPPEAVYLAAQIEYLKGQYAEAERLYRYLVDKHAAQFGLEAEHGLQMVYYQTNAYHKAGSLSLENQGNPLLEMMRAFDDAPYQLDWNGKERTVIPFVASDPLPVVPIEINGVAMNAFLDTGGSTMMIDAALVETLGLEMISHDEGTVAGGLIDFGYGKTDVMKLGDVNVRNIPLVTLSFEGISEVFAGYATDVHAIIGTNVLQRFKVVFDFPSAQLVLMPRDKAGGAGRNDTLDGQAPLEQIPFTLADTHCMYAKGSINGREGLNFFVDSGGADEKGAGLFFIKETMDFLGIPLPETTSSTSIGPNAFEAGWFDLSSYGLGKLQKTQSVGYYDSSGHSDDLSELNGFVHDALISYNYLREYRWAIDFDEMKMTFYR